MAISSQNPVKFPTYLLPACLFPSLPPNYTPSSPLSSFTEVDLSKVLMQLIEGNRFRKLWLKCGNLNTSDFIVWTLTVWGRDSDVSKLLATIFWAVTAHHSDFPFISQPLVRLCLTNGTNFQITYKYFLLYCHFWLATIPQGVPYLLGTFRVLENPSAVRWRRKRRGESPVCK